MCSLGSACDMFFIEFQSNSIKCRYLPHASLKKYNMMDFITFTGSADKDMYVLQCSQGREEIFWDIKRICDLGMEKTFVDNTDWFTHHKEDWEGKFEFLI